jgi:hypothetical protein
MVCSLCLSPLQIVLRIFSFLSKGFKHNTVVLSTLSHLNKTCFHMPMQFPSPTAAVRSMKFWTWEVSLGAVQVQSFDHAKANLPRNWFFSFFINSAPWCGSQHLVCNKSWHLSKGQKINAYDYVQCPPLRVWIWKVKLFSWTKMAHTLDILNWLRDGVILTLETSACQELLWETEYNHLVWLSENLKPLFM